MDLGDLIIPYFSVDLFPVVRVINNVFGMWESVYKGEGYGLAGIRPYQFGDGMHRIAWKATAKHGELLVRETYAERSLGVVIVVDRAPRMGAYDLEKLQIVKTAAGAIINGAQHRNLAVGYLDWAKDKEHYRRPQEGSAHAFKVRKSTTNRNFRAPDNIELQLARLQDFKGHLPKGTLVFLFSDFFVLPPKDLVEEISVVFDFHPVVVQHPVWEMDFPEIEGTFPFVRPENGETIEGFFTIKQARALAEEHCQRYRNISAFFASLDIEPITLTTNDEEECDRIFAIWNSERARQRLR